MHKCKGKSCMAIRKAAGYKKREKNIKRIAMSIKAFLLEGKDAPRKGESGAVVENVTL